MGQRTSRRMRLLYSVEITLTNSLTHVYFLYSLVLTRYVDDYVLLHVRCGILDRQKIHDDSCRGLVCKKNEVHTCRKTLGLVKGWHREAYREIIDKHQRSGDYVH